MVSSAANVLVGTEGNADLSGSNSLEKQTVPESWPLPSRPAFGGRVELFCSIEGINIKAKLLPLKRRLELIDDSKDDLVQIKVGKRVVESDDLEVSVVDGTSWRIEPWSLMVSLVEASADTTLVDLSDSEGRRVLCLAV